jgi:phosphate transport system permease protein
MGAGALLGLARISGKTAPLLVTSPGNPFLSWRVDQPVASLPTVMFHAALSAGIVGRVLARGRDGR